MSAVEFELAADHPAAAGHFPGNPIIPGAVLLCEAIGVMERELGRSLSPLSIRAAKFTAPTRPGDRVALEYSPGASGAIRFACTVRGVRVLDGQLECAAPATA